MPPNFGGTNLHPKLLSRAARYWRISDSPFPPTMDEVLMRDMIWDDAVYAMRQAQDYFVDLPKLRAAKMI